MASQNPSGGFTPVLAGSNNNHTRGRTVVDDAAELTDYSDDETEISSVDNVQTFPGLAAAKMSYEGAGGKYVSYWKGTVQKSFVHGHFEDVTGDLPPWSWSRSKVRLALVNTHYSYEQLLVVADYAGLDGRGAGIDHLRELIRVHFQEYASF